MLQTLEKWVSNKDHRFRKIEIQDHAHGFRVTLTEDGYELCTAVEKSISYDLHSKEANN